MFTNNLCSGILNKLVKNLPIAERWSRAGGINMIRRSGRSGGCAVASITSSGLRISFVESICSFQSFNLKGTRESKESR